MHIIKSILRRIFLKKISLPNILVILFFIVLIRVSVELWLLDYRNFFPILDVFSNYARFYLENIFYFLLLFLFLVSLISLVTQATFTRVANIGIRAAPFIIMPPIVDYFLFKQTDGYTYGSIDNYIENILTLSWASGDTNVGIPLLITLAVCGIGVYVWRATKSISLLLATTAATSVIIMTISTPDLFFGKDGGSFMYDYFIPLFYFFPFIATISILCCFYSKKKFIAILKNLRPERAVIFLGAVMLGFFTTHSILNLSTLLEMPPFVVFSTLFAVAFAWWFAVVVNDIFDWRIDAISNKTRPIPLGILNKKEYSYIAVLFAFLSLSFATATTLPVFIMTVFWLLLGVLYSVPPFRLRKNIMGNIVIGTAVVLSFFMGIFAVQKWNFSILLCEYNIIFVILLFLFTVVISLTKDLKDIVGDNKEGIENVYTVFGKTRGKQILIILLIILFNITPLVVGNLFLLLITLPVSLLLGYFYNKKECHFIMYFGGSFLVFIAFVSLYFY